VTDEWIDLDFSLDDTIEVVELDSIKKIVTDFLIQRNEVTIDGQAAIPTLDRAHYVEVKLSGIQIQEIPAALNYSSAIIGVIFVYPHDSIPQKVEVNWDLWNNQIQTVPCLVTDPAGPMPYDISPSDSVLVWTNYLKNYRLPNVSEIQVTEATLRLPIVSLLIVCLIAYQLQMKIANKSRKLRWGWLLIAVFTAAMTFVIHINVPIPFIKKKKFNSPEAKELISTMLNNTYRAFDFSTESDIYDKLAISMDGELLSEIYIQTKKSMVLENQGGIQVKLKSVDLIDVEEVISANLEKDALAFQCEWLVEGTVGHWGHIHKRINQYQALMKIIPVDGLWKMYDLDMIDESRKQ